MRRKAPRRCSISGWQLPEHTNSLDPGTHSRLHTFSMSGRRPGFRSGQLAHTVGISTDTLRHYERLGVLPKAPRTASGYRIYPPGSPERVNMIRHALRLGFTLAELAEILHTRDRGGAPCKRVLEMLEGKLDSLEKHITELQRMQKYMGQVVADWRSKVGQAQPGKRADLLHSLLAATAPAGTNGKQPRRGKQR
jgi:DNA-binding transcriptional MerR regulator